MPTITLDKIRADIESKYAPVVIDLGDAKVTLTQVLRLSKAKRKALMDAEKAREENSGEEFDEDGLLEHMRNILRIVATDTDEAEYLIETVGDDLVLLSEVITSWREDTQAGEASSSAS